MEREASLSAITRCAVAIGIGASIACGAQPTRPSSAAATETVRLSGQVINADTNSPIEGAQITLGELRFPLSGMPDGWVRPADSTTSDGNGRFTLTLLLPQAWSSASLRLSKPSGFEATLQSFSPDALTAPATRMYPTLVVGAGKSIDMHVESGPSSCLATIPCRRIKVDDAGGGSLVVRLVPAPDSPAMYLWHAGDYDYHEPDPSVREVTVNAGAVINVVGVGRATVSGHR